MQTILHRSIRNLTVSAMLLAVGLLLPFLTGQIPQIGSMLLPMHIPVLLCGLICGWQYGAAVGFLLPLFRYMLFGMPILFPSGIAMAFELATYGFVVGFLYAHAKQKCLTTLYRSMIFAMLAGRIVWGIAEVLLLGVGSDGFTLELFWTSAFFHAIPGIVLQLILIPMIMVALDKTGLVPFTKHSAANASSVM